MIKQILIHLILYPEKQKSNYLVLNDDTYKDVKQITLNEYEKISKECPLERYRMEILFFGTMRYRC